MGIKMNQARLISSGQHMNISGISSSNNGNLKCYYCNAKVSYVEGYVRETKRGSTYVAPFLRLSHSEHDSNCPYNIENAIEAIVSESKALDDSEPILKKNEHGKLSFRLHILQEVSDFLLNYSRGDIYSKDNEKYHGKKYIKNSNQLESYIKTATGIAKLKSIVDSNDDIKLQESIELIFDKQKIPWKDFFYESDRYMDLFTRVESEKLQHPVAILVTIKNDVQQKDKSKYSYSAQCFAGDKKKSTLQKTSEIDVPWILTNDNVIAKYIVKDNNYIIVTTPFATRTKKDNIEFCNLNLPIAHRAQIRNIGEAKPSEAPLDKPMAAQANDKQIDKQYIQGRVNDWIVRINNLYNFIRQALSSHTNIDFMESDSSPMHEELMKEFDVFPVKIPILSIRREKTLIASIRPVGLWVIGANGRLDILTKEGAYILVDMAKEGQNPDWKIYTPKDRTNSVSFDKNFIYKLVDIQ